MNAETWQWITLFSLVAVSVFAFVAVSIWAWRDNVLLFHHMVDRTKHYSNRAHRRWRMWRDAEYRAYAELTDRYEGSAKLMHHLFLKEEAFKCLQQTADNDKNRRFFNMQYHAYRDARIRCQPHVAQILADLDSDSIADIASYLADVDYDQHKVGNIPMELAERVRQIRELVTRQCTMVRSNQNNVIDAVLLLGEIDCD